MIFILFKDLYSYKMFNKCINPRNYPKTVILTHVDQTVVDERAVFTWFTPILLLARDLILVDGVTEKIFLNRIACVVFSSEISLC